MYAAGIDINSCRLHVSATQTPHIKLGDGKFGLLRKKGKIY